MKREIFTLLIAVMLLSGIGVFGTSCSKDEGLQIQSIPIRVWSNEWSVRETDEGVPYYYAEKPLPQLTPFIFTNGSMKTYVYLDIDGQEPLSYTRTRIDSDGFVYTETWREDYYLGQRGQSTIAFYIEASDALIGDRPRTTDFRVVLIW
jgi:hypothetical protein